MTVLSHERDEVGGVCVALLAEKLLGETVAGVLRGHGFDVPVIAPPVPAAIPAAGIGRLRRCVVVIDLDADDGHGWALLSALQACGAEHVIAMSARDTPEVAATAFERGAAGFVSLAAGLEDLRSAIVAVAAGETAIVGVRLSGPESADPPEADIAERGNVAYLTLRESDILARLGRGESTHDIAHGLEISIHTARTHIQNLMVKLDVHSRLEAAAVAARAGLA